MISPYYKPEMYIKYFIFAIKKPGYLVPVLKNQKKNREEEINQLIKAILGNGYRIG